MKDFNWFEAADLALKVMGVLGTLAGMVFGWALWSLRRAMVTHEQFAEFRASHGDEHDELTGRLARGEARFAQVEATLADLPTKNDIADLKIQMERLGGDIRVVTAILQRVESPVQDMVRGALEGNKR